MSYRSRPESITDDLLSVLIDGENSAYPWDLTEVIDREQMFSPIESWEEEEFVDRSRVFFTNLEHCWDKIESSSAPVLSFSQFSARLPEECLTRLVEQARTLVNQPIEVLDRLVACIRPLFPQWSEEDLQLFARPYAYAMRDEPGQIPLEARDWQTLSEFDKIRLSASIASEILQKLST